MDMVFFKPKVTSDIKKTKLILFNPGNSRDIHPRFKLENDDIQMVEENQIPWSCGQERFIVVIEQKIYS